MKSEVHLIDCVEFMRGLDDKAFSLAVVDPPYGIGAGKMTMGSGRHKFKKGKGWDNKTPPIEYWNQLFRISKNQIVWGGNYFTEYLPITPHWIVWDKNNPNLSFAEGELAWVRSGKNLRIFKYYSAQVESGGKIHPTQKPVALYRWLLRNYAKPGDTIFDSHMGSQSSRIACHMEGFDFTGCELDPEYFEQGNQRYETFTKKYGTPDPTTAIQGQQINLF